MSKLRALPPDIPILTTGYENGYENVSPPKIARLTHKADSKYWDGEFQETDEKDADVADVFEAIVLERVVRDA